MARATAIEARLTKSGRRIEEVASRGLGHRIRIEILTALHDGPASITQLNRRIVRQPPGKVWNHIQELLKDGLIEVAYYDEQRNHRIAFYRCTELPFVTDKAAARWTAEERQITAALTLQASTAEALAALWAGKMHSDPRVWLAWQAIVLDSHGRDEFADELQRNWDRVQEIVCDATNRRAETGDEGTTYIVATYGFERHRSGSQGSMNTSVTGGTENAAVAAVKEGIAVEARLSKSGRRIEEATRRALGHRIRIEILAALHDGPQSATQLSSIVRQPPTRAWSHIQELLKDGLIEVAFREKQRNHRIAFYRCTELPFVTDKAAASWTAEERQITAALTLQASTAEALAALWAGKMHSDPRVWLAWQAIVLDSRGRDEFADELQRNWDRVQEIVCDATNRRAETGDEGTTYIVATYGFERHRSGLQE